MSGGNSRLIGMTNPAASRPVAWRTGSQNLHAATFPVIEESAAADIQLADLRRIPCGIHPALHSRMTTSTSVRDERTYAVIGAAMEVHRIVGGGFGENVCADALAIELGMRKIPFKTEVPFPVHYKRHRLRSFYRADFVCFDSVIVELKVLRSKTGPMEEAQMINYLRAAEMTVALLFNFGMPSLEYRRFVLSPKPSDSANVTEEPGERAAKPRAIGLGRAAEE